MNLLWQQPIQELRLRAASLPKTSPGKQSQNQNQPFRVRYCFQYYKGERCNKSHALSNTAAHNAEVITQVKMHRI